MSRLAPSPSFPPPPPTPALRLLARASELLGASLDEQATLERLARFAVADLASACALFIGRADGVLACAEVAHRDPAAAMAVRAILQGIHLRADAPRGLGRFIGEARSGCLRELRETHLRLLSRDPRTISRLRALGLRSALLVPLVARGTVLGAMLLATVERDPALGVEDLPVAEELARRGAIAIDNARLYRREQVARARAQLSEARAAMLSEMTAELAASFDLRQTLPKALRRIVPGVAEWCVADLVLEDGQVERMAVVHADPAKDELAQELLRHPPSLEDDPFVAPVLRSAEPLLVRPGAMPSPSLHPRTAPLAPLLRRLGVVSALVVPLVTRGRVLGAVSLFKGPQARRHFDDADIAHARELAGRAAVAIDNAKLYAEAQREIRLREGFLSIASHELKTPLTSMALHVQSLARYARRTDVDAEQLRARLVDKLDVTERQVRRLGALVDELLDVSRINAGRLELDRTSCDLGALVRDVAERFRHQFDEAGCVLTVDVPAPVIGRWDASRLDQVVTNLLQNAAKYGAGRPVHVSVGALAGEARLVVRDEGIGIDADAQPRLFAPFVRAVSHRQFTGLGLGLYIVRRIAEGHGGTIALESAPGRGASFTVRLPLEA